MSNTNGVHRHRDNVDAGNETLPADVRREIEARVLEDPMWYAGRLGIGVEEVLDANDETLARLTDEAKKVDWAPPPDGNGNGVRDSTPRRRRTPA